MKKKDKKLFGYSEKSFSEILKDGRLNSMCLRNKGKIETPTK
jgi:hypothetical protein